MEKERVRCVNLDWLELYVLESRDRYPCDADYFRSQGYFVEEREYGTRQFRQMFTIEDDKGNPWIEIRRDPATNSDKFSGFVPESVHLRLTNRACYFTDSIERLRQFLIKHDYTFKRIYRIDICYDFEKFDSGDRPADFARRIMEKKIRKINQSKLHTYAMDNWQDFDFESLSWGNPTSMVSTKMYNKSKELARPAADKPYIRYCWFQCGLIDDPFGNTKRNSLGQLYKPEIWRVEFSMKSKVDRWLVIEDTTRKGNKHKALPHRLDMFDSPEKLWQRFQDLAFHYFRFKIQVKKTMRQGLTASEITRISKYDDWEEQRKDRCPDKVLFHWDKGHVFMQAKDLPPAERIFAPVPSLWKALEKYSREHLDPRVVQACNVLLDSMRRDEVVALSPSWTREVVEAMRRTIAIRMKWKDRDVAEVMAEIKELLHNHQIF